ncbi:hypothetical protein PHMEG_00038001 [Phytophthora megakarya]|uniref:PiggyBac transposable element-derived protein domain-containing protein n=1 Tax=Phytophthora megakarya TaxID=4795 RepID=A0A225UIQ8_9STRA|nr:hypothetical protein PHMEG_00038001 [Phytophthora megakarya]
MDNLISGSGLQVQAAYKECGELGLFFLFFTCEFQDSLQLLTNKMLNDIGKSEATVYEIDVYLGLEIAMSFNPVTKIKELWSKKIFMGQPDFGLTVARTRFESIRARFQIHAPDSVPVERREQDPLWQRRRLMRQIQEKFAAIAVPVGAISLDENTVRTKARSSARIFMPLKPINMGLYAYSVWDNESGNRTRLSPVQRYVDVFPALRTPLVRTVVSIARKYPSALWVAVCGHLTKTHAAPNGHRLLVCDKFYTRHVLCKTLMEFTDSEMKILGTVRITLQGQWNGIELEAARARMDKAERGTWELVVAVGVPSDWQKLQEKHKRLQQKLPSHLQTEYVLPMNIAANAGYIVFRDKLTVNFI